MATKKVVETNKTKRCQLLGFGQIKQMGDSVVIEGLANKNVIDRGNELITTDAWDLDNYKKNPVILYNHGFDPQLGATPVGKATEIRPTEDGLFIKAKLASINDPMINRIRGLVEEKILRAFSVGFNPIEADVDPKTGVRTIKKAELFEVSIVGVPMNQDSLFELSSKMLKKPEHELKRDIFKRKGAWVAAAIHNRIYELQKDEGLDRMEALERVADMTDMEMDALKDVLAGNTTPVPEPVLVAFSEVLSMDLDELKKLDAGDVEVEKGAEGDDAEGEEGEGEGQSGEEEGGEGADAQTQTSSTETGDADKEGMGEGDEEADKDDAEKQSSKAGDFQECVADKIRKLIDEGKEQDQAVAIAISMCSEGKSGKGLVKPTKDQYAQWFKIADEAFEKKHAKVKQADQEEAGVSGTTTTINAAKTETENNDFGSPMLEAQKQTNVLLGALVNEIQKLSAKLDGINTSKSADGETDVAEGGEGGDAKPSDQEGEASSKKSGEPEDGMSDEDLKAAQQVRSETFGIEILEGSSLTYPEGSPKGLDKYGDPVNLKFPLDSAERADSARKEFKDKASDYKKNESKAAVHNRIVTAQLGFDGKPEYSEEDELDKMLSDDLKGKLRESQAKTLDSYRKRIENVKKRLDKVQSMLPDEGEV